MKQFFKFIFGSCLGTLLAFGVVFIIFYTMALGGAAVTKVSDNSVLHLELNTIVPELTDNVAAGGFSFESREFIGLNDIRRVLKAAASDEKIKGILIQTENTPIKIASQISCWRKSV